MTEWHILTGEYPPQPGGVSDYTRLVAHGLAAAGDRVIVWAPPCDDPDARDSGVEVRRLPDRFGPRSLRELGCALDRVVAVRLLVQYVPHAFGWKAANVPFCLWLASRRREALWVMFHEVAYPSGPSYRLAENALSVVTRRMAAIIGQRADRIFVSIPAWQSVVESLTTPRAPIAWLPVPSGVPVVADPARAAAIRGERGASRPVVGHLSAYGALIRPMLMASIPPLLASTESVVLLLGRGASDVKDALIEGRSPLADRIHAVGELSGPDLSCYIAACDIMWQPYRDGISSRRSSAMAALAHGRPVVTTVGPLSEPLWSESGSVVMVSADRPVDMVSATAALIDDRPRQLALSIRSRELYTARFDLAHAIAALRSADHAPTAAQAS